MFGNTIDRLRGKGHPEIKLMSSRRVVAFSRFRIAVCGQIFSFSR
jgi:hypothetical protein